jgi:glycosidase
MRLDTLELMLYGGPFNGATATSDFPGLRVVSTVVPENASFAFVRVAVSRGVRPGTHFLHLTTPAGNSQFPYTLMTREDTAGLHQGFGPQDVVYLIMPDRFSDGDTLNNNVPGLREGCDRQNPFGRHGGDIQGIINHLDYLQDLGVTALWINPLVENDNPRVSYHGYAATDLYRVDPRYGTNVLYHTFVREAHQRGIKIIMDHVNNHVSIHHPWIAGLPSHDWLHGSVQNHLPISHLKGTLNDVQSDPALRLNVVEGWFTDSMPDLNQHNPHLRRYLIQNTLWWIESTGLDGIREDTYPYVDQEFLNAWCRAILTEYPRFNIVGEVWINEPSLVSSFQRGNRLVPERKAELPTITDFPLYEALKAATRKNGSISSVFNCILLDFCYAAPESLLTFVDNHDVPRISFMTREDPRRRTIALTILLTTRGIPELLYGTELGLVGGPDHATLRTDMPGGFPGDQRDAFSKEGRTESEREWFGVVRELLHLRQSCPALSSGALVHFPPEEEVYVYFRIAKGSTFFVVANNSETRKTVRLERFGRYIPATSALRQIFGQRRTITPAGDGLNIDGVSAEIFQVIPPTQ